MTELTPNYILHPSPGYVIQFSDLDDLISDPGIDTILSPFRVTSIWDTKTEEPFSTLTFSIYVQVFNERGHLLQWWYPAGKIRYMYKPAPEEKEKIESVRKRATEIKKMIVLYTADTRDISPSLIKTGLVAMHKDLTKLEGILPDLSIYYDLIEEEE